MGYTEAGEPVEINKLWEPSTLYQIQWRSILSKRSRSGLHRSYQAQIKALVEYYMNNAKMIREGVASTGIEVFGGVNAPYIWLKTPAGMDSWTFLTNSSMRSTLSEHPG